MISETEIIEFIREAKEGPTLDYKEDLLLTKDGDKAEFVKDVLALANSGETAHIITGVEDGTGRPVGFKTHHTAEQINQILKDKCDPPISVEYIEKNILGYDIGVIEFKGENSPYIVSVPDKYGGRLSTNPNRSFHIQRGTVYVRNYNMNQGAKRADLDKIYDRIKYVSLQANLQLSHEVSAKPLEDLIEIDITFFLENVGEVIASDTYVWLQFKNIREIVRCKDNWRNVSSYNENTSTVSIVLPWPVVRPIKSDCGGVVVKVDTDVQQIEARVIMGAMNMRSKDGPYAISLKATNESN